MFFDLFAHLLWVVLHWLLALVWSLTRSCSLSSVLDFSLHLSKGARQTAPRDHAVSAAVTLDVVLLSKVGSLHADWETVDTKTSCGAEQETVEVAYVLVVLWEVVHSRGGSSEEEA